MKILIFSNIPAPYFVEYLNELGKFADIIAVFERRSASDRDRSWEIVNAKRFSYYFLQGIKIGHEAVFSFQIRKYIKKYKDRIIIFGNPTTPSGIIGINYCKRKKIKYCLQSEGGLVGNGKGFKERFKRKLFRGAELYLTGMKPETDYFHAYGAPVSKIIQYPFASFKKEDILSQPLSLKEKSVIKDSLGIKQDKIVLFVGRMLKGKGVDVLLKAFQSVNGDVGLFCVGGKPSKSYISIIKRLNLKNVFFIEHLNLTELKKYYMASDVFVLPTRSDTWGLVINEAMSYGLPIITTNKCVAGLELIECETNGYLVEAGDYKTISRHIEHLLNDSVQCVKMGFNNINKIQEHNYESMANSIFDALSTTFKEIRSR